MAELPRELSAVRVEQEAVTMVTLPCPAPGRALLTLTQVRSPFHSTASNTSTFSNLLRP